MHTTLRGTMVWTSGHGCAMDVRWVGEGLGDGEVVPGSVPGSIIDCFSCTIYFLVWGELSFSLSCVDRV